MLVNNVIERGDFQIFNNTIIIDYLSFSSKTWIAITSIFCFLMSQRYINIQKINFFEYSILILFALLGIFFICSSNDLITAYLAIELQSLSFYIMAAMKKDSAFSVDAGLKYFILGAFSSSLFLFAKRSMSPKENQLSPMRIRSPCGATCYNRRPSPSASRRRRDDEEEGRRDG